MNRKLTQLGPAQIPGLRRIPSIARSVTPNVVIFDSWRGRYSDNPRAISEELTSRKAPLHQVWVSSRPTPHFPPNVTVVKRDSWRYLAYLAQARYIVTSNGLPAFYRKPRDCVYVQTWHGTPLKRIAFDIQEPRFMANRRHTQTLRREVARWDFLISQNSFSTKTLSQAFRYHGAVLETGYPRNDLLSTSQAPDIRLRVRQALGIDQNTCVVLYAPTWRDNATFSLKLDLVAMANALGTDFVLLLRAHQLVASTVSLPCHPRIHDVSHWDDIRDLYLAADVLITDYSSVMFDFAVTRKPILFFTFDIDRYRDQLRGFYFDLESQAPGPLLNSTTEVIAALKKLSDVSARYTDPYDRFVASFCPRDDGNASARVIDSVFSA